MSNVKQHYMFTDIPGSGKGWTLIVTAVSLKDAREYVKCQHGRGRFVGLHTPTPTDWESGMCGAITDAAQKYISVES